MDCPCQSGKAFKQCCQPLIEGKKQAETAEQLMRARYTAYTQVQMDFIEKTHDPENNSDIDMEESREWAETTKWTGLEIIETKQGGVHDDIGTVEFEATHETDEGPKVHHELSLFKKRDGVWFYSDSANPKGQTYVRNDPKVGRNDPCPCGSGKKFKKCCG
jgi:SEC-C motif-containing protein